MQIKFRACLALLLLAVAAPLLAEPPTVGNRGKRNAALTIQHCGNHVAAAGLIRNCPLKSARGNLGEMIESYWRKCNNPSIRDEEMEKLS